MMKFVRDCMKTHQVIYKNEYWFEQNVVGIDYNYDENNDKCKYVVFVEDVYDKQEVT